VFVQLNAITKELIDTFIAIMSPLDAMVTQKCTLGMPIVVKHCIHFDNGRETVAIGIK